MADLPSGALLTLESIGDGSSVKLDIRPTSYPTLTPAFRATSTSTALIFDERVMAHRIPSGDHPERPERVTAVRDALVKGGLMAHCVSVPARLVTRAEVELVHEINHWDKMEWAISQELSALEAWTSKQESLYMNGSSLDAARCAAGSVVELTREVMSGRARNGMALVRPPGHHAEAHAAMGFCVLNTCAIAAQVAREQLGCRRVLIVDWDIHHGNGIQHIFEDDPSVLYFSVHRYEYGKYFPSDDLGIGTDGSAASVGVGVGRGTSVNIGWNTRGGAKPGDTEYRAAWSEVLMPIAREFAPDLVIVAAGFDAAEGDPLGQCHVTPACYTAMTRDLMSLADGRVVLALEGGYSLAATAVSAAACMEGLLGLAAPAPAPAQPECTTPKPLRKRSGNNPFARFRQRDGESEKDFLERQPSTPSAAKENKDPVDRGARRAIDQTRQVHADYWQCMRSSVSEKPPALTPKRAPASAKKTAAPPDVPPPVAVDTFAEDELSAAVAKLGLSDIATTPVATPTRATRSASRGPSIAPVAALTPFAEARAAPLPPPPATPKIGNW